MSVYTDTLIDIEEAVTRYLFAYKKPLEDATLYIEHACQCYQDFNLYDGNIVQYQKYTLDLTKKWLDMPEDMQAFVNLVVPSNGSYWSFTEKQGMVTTTSTSGGVESQDEDWGEGKHMDQDRVTTYGAKGGWNKFRYNIDWATRRIYIDGDITENIILFYVSSGIKASGTTEIPTFLLPMIHSYLLWKESYWLPELVRERPAREQDYWKEKMKVRNLINAMSYDQWRDIFMSSFTQAPRR